jgi:hypothetical protein
VTSSGHIRCRGLVGTAIGLLVMLLTLAWVSAQGSVVESLEWEWPDAWGEWLAVQVSPALDIGAAGAMVIAMFPLYAGWLLELSGPAWLLAGVFNRIRFTRGVALSLLVFGGLTSWWALDSAAVDVVVIYQLCLLPIYVLLYSVGWLVRGLLSRGTRPTTDKPA